MGVALNFGFESRIPFPSLIFTPERVPAKINNLLVNTLRSTERETCKLHSLRYFLRLRSDGMKHSNFAFNLGINEEERE